VLEAMGTLWAHGVELPQFRPARRVPLPVYPFERQRHWLEPR
jgi:acyl transferase domain-containing protein